MPYPINHSFVTSKKIKAIVPDALFHNEQEIVVLVLDEKANDEYFKRMYSFAKFLQELNLTALDQAKTWEISTAFANHVAFIDLCGELEGHPVLPTALTTFFNLPVSWIDSTDEFCCLVMANGEVKENNHWK